MKLLAEVSSTQDTVAIWGAVISVVAGSLAILSFFATRREVDKIDERVGTLEDELKHTNASALPEMERRMKDEGERRAVKLHNRINRANKVIDRIAGKMGIYVSDPAEFEDEP